MLEIGRVARAHGLRGEVAVELISNRPDRVVPGAEFEAGGRRLVVASCRPHQGRPLVQFRDVTTREQAEALRGLILLAEPADEADDDSEDDGLWVHRLIGSEVHDTAGANLGRVASVEANPASDLLVLDGGGLIPCRFVVSHDDGLVVVDIPEGLLDPA